jgi:hypothetical protein
MLSWRSRDASVDLEGIGFCFHGVVEMLQLILKVVGIVRGLG